MWFGNGRSSDKEFGFDDPKCTWDTVKKNILNQLQKHMAMNPDATRKWVIPKITFKFLPFDEYMPLRTSTATK